MKKKNTTRFGRDGSLLIVPRLVIMATTVASATAAAPVAYDDLITAKQGVAITLDYLTLNDKDADGNALSITAITNPAHGTLTALGGSSYRYTPNTGYVGRDTFTYTVSDGTGSFDTAQVTISVNAQFDVEAARTAILTGVNQVPEMPWGVGNMNLWGATAVSISNFPGKDESSPLIGAATMGAGRVVVMPHFYYMRMSDYAGQFDMANLYRNSIGWIAGTADKSIRIVTLDSKVSTWLTSQGYTNVTLVNSSGLAAALINADLFVPGWISNTATAANLTSIKNFVSGGGGMLCCDYGAGSEWWWNQNRWEISTSIVLREAGIAFMDGVIGGQQWATNRAVNTLSLDQVLAVAANPSAYSQTQQERAAVSFRQLALFLHPDDIDRARCMAIYRSRIASLIPTPSAPVTNYFDRVMLELECSEINALPPAQMTAHRAALPVSTAAPRVNGATFSLVSPPAGHYTKTIYTPYYAAPGELVTIQFPAALTGLNLDVRVGHLRDANGATSYPVMPKQMLNYDVTTAQIQVASPHGGLIQIIVPDQVTWSGTQNITVTGAVEAPYFRLGTTTDAQWAAGIRSRGTPFGVLDSDEATLVIDANKWLRTLSDPVAVMTEWNYFCGKLRQFYVYNPGRQLPMHHDYYPAGGVSTYPQSYGVTDEITNSLDLKASAYSLTLHEYGHICDSGNIIFKEFGETSPNMGGKWVQDTERRYSWKQELVVGRVNNYLSLAGDDLWNQYSHYSVDRKGTPFDLLSAEFGATMIQQCVAAMTAMSGLSNDQAKLDEWVRQTSNRTGYNLSAFFASWQLNVSAATLSELSSKPNWMPVERGPESLTLVQGTSVVFANPSSNDFSYDGGLTLTNVSQPGNGTISSNGNGTYTYTPAAGFTGNTSFTYTVTNTTGNTFTTTVPVKVLAAANDPKLTAFDGYAKGGVWTTVPLAKSYQSMVVVAQPVVGAGSPPVVARIRNATGSSFEVRLDRLDGSTTPVGPMGVRFLVVEEGVYNEATHGIKMEAVKFTSSTTDRAANFTGTKRNFAYTGYDHYFIPAVFGQVMTTNDNRWSAFWYKADTNYVQIGKHVGEDTVTTRANETIGYIVMESGGYQFGNEQIQVGVTNYDGYAGFDLISENAASHDFVRFPALHSAQVSASVEVPWGASDSGMDGFVTLQKGADGNTLSAYLAEDSIGDVETTTGGKSCAYLLAHRSDGSPISKTDQLVALSAKDTLIKVLANDDISGVATVQLTQPPANGVVTVNADGTLTYTSNAGFIGSDAFVYTVINAQGSTSAVVNLQVEPIAVSQAGIKADRFNGISGGSISNLTSSPNFPSSPSTSAIWTTVNSGLNVGDNLGHRIYGYVVPPTSGDYTFWIASDDNSQLFLSTDFSAANKKQIARVGGYANYQSWDENGSQKSTVIPLEAGRAYYLEVLHKEGGGGDHVSVAWQGPGFARTLLANPSIFTAGNTAPTIAAAPSNVSMDENASVQVNLAGIFANADAGDRLMIEMHGNSRPDVVGTSISGNTLMVSQVGNEAGSAVITLRVYDRTNTLLTTSFTVTVNDSVPDSDGDGLTDSWEVQYFGNLAAQSASGDPDGDGFSNVLEQATGSNPYSGSSKPDPIYAGLRAWWRMNEVAGTVATDMTGAARDGTLVNGPTWSSGVENGALTFDGSNDKMDLGYGPTLIGNTDFTASVWVKLNAGAGAGSIISQREPGASGHLGEYVLRTKANGTVEFFLYNNGVYQFNFASTQAINDGKWHHVAAVRSGTNGYLYIDGVLAGQGSGTIRSLLNLKVYIGYDGRDNNKFLNGQLDDVRLYARAINATEAGQMYGQYALPLPWSNATLGTGALVGASQYANGKYTVSGSGVLGGTADQTHSVYQALTGDGEIQAKIATLHNTGSGASVGIVVRDSLASGAKQVFVGSDGAGTYKWSRRTTVGGTATVTNGSSGSAGSQWVKIVRNGDTFTMWTSADGSSWSVLGTTSVTMASNCYIGLCVSSGSATTINTSQFTHVIVTP